MNAKKQSVNQPSLQSVEQPALQAEQQDVAQPEPSHNKLMISLPTAITIKVGAFGETSILLAGKTEEWFLSLLQLGIVTATNNAAAGIQDPDKKIAAKRKKLDSILAGEVRCQIDSDKDTILTDLLQQMGKIKKKSEAEGYLVNVARAKAANGQPGTLQEIVEGIKEKLRQSPQYKALEAAKNLQFADLAL